MEPSKTSHLDCTLCKHGFNLKNREPIYLICCQETACRHCFETLMMKSENKEHVIKGQFECSFCHADHCAPKGYKEPIELGLNKLAKK